MATNGEQQYQGSGRPQRWWFNTKTMRVEPDDTPAPTKDLLGPYPTREEAARALEKVRERNRSYDDED